MSNHIHLVAVPHQKDALARSLKETPGRFASYWNAINHSSGHVWQGRYYSCPLDERHLWEALRYTELNPVRASLVIRASDWPWSSAAVHCGAAPAAAWLDTDRWQRRWSTDHWRAHLETTQEEANPQAVRNRTYSGRPLGSAEFIRALEREAHRPLTPQKPGPKKIAAIYENNPGICNPCGSDCLLNKCNSHPFFCPASLQTSISTGKRHSRG